MPASIGIEENNRHFLEQAPNLILIYENIFFSAPHVMIFIG